MSSRNHLGRAVALALVIAMAATAPAAAQRAGSFELSAFGGGYFGSTIYSGQVNGSGPPVTVNLNAAGMYGARAGINFSRQFGLELSWSAADPQMDFSSSGFSSGKPKGDLSINNFDLDLMFNFGQQRVWGYFAIGGGMAIFSPNVTYLGSPVDISTKNYLSGNSALGLKFFVTPHLALQFDARYRWSNTNHTTSAGVGCVYYCYTYASTYYGASEISGGLTYVAFK